MRSVGDPEYSTPHFIPPAAFYFLSALVLALLPRALFRSPAIFEVATHFSPFERDYRILQKVDAGLAGKFVLWSIIATLAFFVFTIRFRSTLIRDLDSLDDRSGLKTFVEKSNSANWKIAGVAALVMMPLLIFALPVDLKTRGSSEFALVNSVVIWLLAQLLTFGFLWRLYVERYARKKI